MKRYFFRFKDFTTKDLRKATRIGKSKVFRRVDNWVCLKAVKLVVRFVSMHCWLSTSLCLDRMIKYKIELFK